VLTVFTEIVPSDQYQSASTSAKLVSAKRRLTSRGKRAPSGWQVGIYPRSADLPILSRCEIFAPDPNEGMVMAKGRVDRANY
jgi:hypothetical protein